MKTVTLALAAAMSLTAGMASAFPDTRTPMNDEVGRVVLRYPELDLRREEGARMLIGRIKLAAHVACGAEPSSLSLAESRRFQTCVTEATSRSVARVGSPLVTAVYRHDAQRQLLAQR